MKVGQIKSHLLSAEFDGRFPSGLGPLGVALVKPSFSGIQLEKGGLTLLKCAYNYRS